jgi:large subunit ribosomal protein L5e
MKEDTPEKYAAHFSTFVKEGVEPEDLEDLYKEVHEAIRADPSPKLTEKKKPDTKKQ